MTAHRRASSGRTACDAEAGGVEVFEAEKLADFSQREVTSHARFHSVFDPLSPQLELRPAATASAHIQPRTTWKW